MGDYFDHDIDDLSSAQLTDYFSDLIASHLLHSGFLRTIPRGFALAFGSWLSFAHDESKSVLPQGTCTP